MYGQILEKGELMKPTIAVNLPEETRQCSPSTLCYKKAEVSLFQEHRVLLSE